MLTEFRFLNSNPLYPRSWSSVTLLLVGPMLSNTDRELPRVRSCDRVATTYSQGIDIECSVVAIVNIRWVGLYGMANVTPASGATQRAIL